jgi:hypothetical protein
MIIKSDIRMKNVNYRYFQKSPRLIKFNKSTMVDLGGTDDYGNDLVSIKPKNSS